MTGDDGAGRADGRTLSLLVCPLTRTALEYDAERQELISRAAALAFPIRGGIPLMTVEAARPLGDNELKPRSPLSGD
jgi:uncharacterized protein YbaR (Trm112 family)